MRLQSRGDTGERAARHRRGDGRDARLVPADAGVDQRRAGGLDRPGLHHDFVPCQAVIDEVDHRQAIDEDEVRAARLADAAHDLDRETHAPAGVATECVLALVGARRGELVEQIALRAHHLDAVVASVTGEPRGIHERLDLALDASGRQRARRERIDRRLEPARRDLQRVIAVAAGVQDLQADAAAVRVHGARDLAVLAHLPRPAQLAAERLEPAADVRREAAGDHQADAAGRALAEVRGQLWEVGRLVLQPGVHRAHQHAIGQRAEAEVERREQVWIERMRYCWAGGRHI